MATRILYVITKASWGGAQRYVYDLATAAKSAGLEVAVACGEPGLLVERLRDADIRTVAVAALGRDVHLGRDIKAYRYLYRLFKEERPDIVHLNSSKAGIAGALAARLAGVRSIIFTAHGWAFTEDRPYLVRTIFRVMHWLTILLATRVIAVSKFVADHAPLFGLPKSRVALVRLGIGEPPYLPREEARAALARLSPPLQEAPRALWIGSVGELHKNKGVDIGVAAWQKAALGNTEWIIIGEGEDGARLRRVSAHLPSIHYLGFVADAARYMKAFDVLLLPSRTEALGYAILEAGLAGVPVLSSGVGGTREVLGPEYPTMGFFMSEDSDSLAEILRASIKDRNYLSEVGQALRTHVRNTFSLDQMVDETLALYTKP